MSNTKANSFYQKEDGGSGQRRGPARWPVKAGRALKNTLSSDFSNLPKTMVCVLQHLQTSVSGKEKRLGLGELIKSQMQRSPV